MKNNSKRSSKTELTTWEIGPFHGLLNLPIRLKLSLDGEVIASCEVETGFLHRGLEKACELHSWNSLIAFADHLDPEGAVFGELAVCLAVEEIAEIAVPPRAQAIRLILAELTRVSAHLFYMVHMAKAVGSETILHYLLRDREKILDLFELLTGARFSLNFLRFGGVRADVTEGFIERVLDVCELIRIKMKEYNDLFTFNSIFLKRTAFIGPISGDLVRFCGITGPNARASGISVDIRKDFPYMGYDQLEFAVQLGLGEGGQTGDAHDRFLVRLRELTQSTDLLKQLADSIPSGEFIFKKPDKDYIVPVGEAYSRIESAKGLLGCHVVSDGKGRPSRVQFRPPTFSNLMAIPKIVSGIKLEDLPVVLASLDLGIAEADR